MTAKGDASIIENKLRFGICEWLMPVNGPAAFVLAGELGYDGVQILDLGGEANNFPLANPITQNIYKKYAQQANITIQTLQLQSLVRSGKLKSARDCAQFASGISEIKKGAEACAAIGIKNLMIESFFDSAINNDFELDKTGVFLAEAAKVTQDYGIQLIYESFVPVDKTMKLYEMSNKGFKLCYDVLNPLKYGFGDPLDELKVYPLEMIDHIHCKDTAADYSCSEILGLGSGHFNGAAELLKGAGYTGWLVSENYYCAGAFGRENDPYDSMKKDLAAMKRTFS